MTIARILDHAEDDRFDLRALLEKLYAYRNDIKRKSTADEALNAYRDRGFEQCGNMGDAPEGLFTLTALTGTGKTLALLHFALRHCLKHGKKRIIIVLPFLTLAEQSAGTYAGIVPNLLIGRSQSDLPEGARELAARWSAPVIITTSVRFWGALLSDRPTACRKLHRIANSVALFDEAQSLPANLTSATLRTVNALCDRCHTTMVFFTAAQPDFAAREALNWTPREILPEYAGAGAAVFHPELRNAIESRSFARRGSGRISEQTVGSGVYLLRPQYQECCSGKLGLCLPRKNGLTISFKAQLCTVIPKQVRIIKNRSKLTLKNMERFFTVNTPADDLREDLKRQGAILGKLVQAVKI